MSFDSCISDIYLMLDFRNSYSTRITGIEMAKKITDLSLLIMPPASPSVWEECAKILSSKTDEELCLYLPKLLEWLQDIDWPGAFDIYNRLMKFSGGYFDTVLDNVMKRSQFLKDDMWTEILCKLKSDRSSGTNSFLL